MSIESRGFSQESGQENEAKPQEIERKFKVENLPPDLEKYPKKEIAQGYVEILDDGTETRVRKTVNPNGTIEYVQTTKSGGGEVRSEEEGPITKEQFDDLWSQTDGRIVEKNRYEIPYKSNGKDYKIELDIFKDKLNGLVSVEVEFGSLEDSKNFTPPEWFGEDVSEDKDYKNKTLAVHGLPEGVRLITKESSVEQNSSRPTEEDIQDRVEHLKSLPPFMRGAVP